MFDKIKAGIKTAELDTTRIDNDEYFEAVVKKTGLSGVVRTLEEVFGSPAWPSRKSLSKDVEKTIINFGGLRNGQTLYFLRKEALTVFAMLWPWQDGERITIKVGKVK